MNLPDAFIHEMRGLFSQFGRAGETAAFLDSFQAKPYLGLRANTLKIVPSDLRRWLAAAGSLSPEQLTPVAWTDDGFYYPAGFQPGKLALYAAGLYYIQEPSAMLPAMILAARPGDKILDLCAAPGGKTCKIAADLQGEGLLWANEISSERARALLHNIELTGCTNCILTRESPGRLNGYMNGCFDKILVDTPCSGSGMFRRDPSAVTSWLSYGSDHYAGMQRDILRKAWLMLHPGGSLVYSTCTFSLAENEAMVQWLVDEFPDCQIEPIQKTPGVSDGLPLTGDMVKTARIWPHLAKGEGHFCALLRKASAISCRQPEFAAPGLASGLVHEQAAGWAGIEEAPRAWQVFRDFCRDNLSEAGNAKIGRLLETGHLRQETGALHIVPAGGIIPAGINKMKTGYYLGQATTLRDGRNIFEPSQAFLFGLRAEDVRRQITGPAESDLVNRYLHGETLNCPLEWSEFCGQYAAVLLDASDLESPADCRLAFPIGWTKIQDGHWLKNLYPKAWRRMS